MFKASKAYGEIVKSANNTDKYLAFCLKQPATRKFMLGEDIEVLVKKRKECSIIEHP